jgi:LemA protein
VSNLWLIVVGLGAAALLIWLIAAFNSLATLRIRLQNAWAEVDVQLKRRHDLIPNLVNAVQGYMAHERQTLEAVTEARSRAVAAVGPGTVPERMHAESVLTGALSRWLVVAERYPQLRAVESVQLLQEQLVSTENRIAFARQFYNDEVMKFNTAQATFPRNLVAAVFGFSPATMFEVEGDDRANVEVNI